MKVAHIITNTNYGGAEMMLYKILSQIDRSTVPQSVYSLMECGPVGEKIEQLGIPVKTFQLKRTPWSMWRVKRELTRTLKAEQPDVVQTWLYHADLFGGLAARNAGNIPVIWNLRNSSLDPAIVSRSVYYTAKVCAWYSRTLPQRILSNSHVAIKPHREFGYDDSQMQIIPNGFELDRFQPDSQARERLHQDLNLPDEALIVGNIGRYHRQKDYPLLIETAAAVVGKHPHVHFVIAGKELTPENQQLQQIQQRYKQLRGKIHWLGPRSDTPQLIAGFDIGVISSKIEGFSNALGEMMACGLACVSTESGDAQQILSDTGLVVPIENKPALTQAINQLIEMTPLERLSLGQQARERMLKHYSLNVITAEYLQLWQEISGKRITTPASEPARRAA